MNGSTGFLRQLIGLQKQHVMLLLLVLFAAVVLSVTAIILSALQTMADRANTLDENRSYQTMSGALKVLRNETATSLHDYAEWDDAARAVYQPGGEAWIDENFVLDDPDSAVFDAAYLLGPNFDPVRGYSNGQVLSVPPEVYLSPAFSILMAQARSGGFDAPGEVSGFVSTQDGLAVAAIAAIRPASDAVDVSGREPHYLVFVRHLDDAMIKNLSMAYLVPDIKVRPPNMTLPGLPVVDPSGAQIARLEWAAQAPGDASYKEVKPTVLLAVLIIGVFFVGMMLIGATMISRLRVEETEASRKALIDPLSGLANRAGLHSGLIEMTASAERNGMDIVLLYLDMDGFKEVNDIHGHAMGDLLIMRVASGLSKRVPEDAILARLGGDEFAIAFPQYPEQQSSRYLEGIVLDFFASPFVLGDRQAVSVGASIGTAVSVAGAIDGEELLRRADIAMYRAKSEGRGRVVSYDEAMDTDLARRKVMEDELRQALDSNELFVVYQPLIEASTRRIIGVEALLRWTSPRLGPISPDIFIPLAEHSGLINRIGHYVMCEALRVAHQFPYLNMSINVSPAQFRNPFFLPDTRDLLKSSDVSPGRITLELTEGFLINNPDRPRETIDALKALGFKIALDDFGSGFSSIGYLRLFGFHRLKLDRSMITALDTDPSAGALLQATLSLARALDMPVTAEGIETEEQASILSLVGCDQLQGYLFSRPVSVAALGVLLGEQDRLTA